MPGLLSLAVFGGLLAAWLRWAPPAQPVGGPLLSCALTQQVYEYQRCRPLLARLLLDGAEVTSVGDSRMMMAPAAPVMAEVLGYRSFNHARPIGYTGELPQLVSEVSDLSPRKLIVGLSPGGLANRPTSQPPGEGPWVVGRAVIDRTLNQAAERLIGRYIPYLTVRTGFDHTDAGTFFSPLSQWTTVYARSKNPTRWLQATEWQLKLQKERRTENLQVLGDQLKHLQQRGWSIVCIRMPISQGMWALEERYFPSQQFVDMCRTNSLLYLDYSREPFEPYDGSHLQAAESIRFTYRLADDLRQQAGW